MIAPIGSLPVTSMAMTSATIKTINGMTYAQRTAPNPMLTVPTTITSSPTVYDEVSWQNISISFSLLSDELHSFLATQEEHADV